MKRALPARRHTPTIPTTTGQPARADRAVTSDLLAPDQMVVSHDHLLLEGRPIRTIALIAYARSILWGCPAPASPRWRGPPASRPSA